MRLRADRIGALDVFLDAPGELDEATTHAGQVLTDLATITQAALRRTRPGWRRNWSMR
jgi:hypothetical protein